MSTGDTASDALRQYLAQSAADLAQSGDGPAPDSEGLLFLGTWHQSYPAILVRDPFLSDSAKIQFLFLMQESCRNPGGAIAMPDLATTADVLGHAKRTVQRDRALLRICRWISQYQAVRDARGRFCGTINAIHSEPCTLNAASRLDRTYLRLLETHKTQPDPYLRGAAEAALGAIDETLAAGEDPLEPADQMTRRIQASRAVQSGGGSFFELMMPADGRPARKTPDPPATGHGVATPEPGPEPSNSQPQSTGHPVATAEPSDPAGGNSQLTWPDKIEPNEQGLIQRLFNSQSVIDSRTQQDILDALACKLEDTQRPLRNTVSYARTLCQRVADNTFQPTGPPRRAGIDNGSGNAASTADRARSERRQRIRALDAEIRGLTDELIPGAPTASRPQLEKQRDARIRERDQLIESTRDTAPERSQPTQPNSGWPPRGQPRSPAMQGGQHGN